MTRRDLSSLLPAFGFLGTVLANAQTSSSSVPLLSHSGGFVFDQLPVKRSSSGAASRPVIRGTLPTGEFVEMHETTLLPGQMPHGAHHHRHTEFILVREGTVEFTANGTPTVLGPGGVAYAASEEMHGLKNTGSVPANYFVIAIGTD